jgi:ATP synthase F1 delta subunit
MSVAKTYAKALFEAAQDAKVSVAELEQYETFLDGYLQLASQSKEIRVALISPATSSKEKVALVTEISSKLKFPKILSNFFALLARKERMALLPEIREAYGAVRWEQEGGILGKIVSADPLEKADIDGLAKAFGDKLKRRVAFRATTDSTLLAG